MQWSRCVSAVYTKECLSFAQSIDVCWHYILVVDEVVAVIVIEVDGQANQVGQGHAQIHEGDVQKDHPGPRSSFLEEDVGENDEQRSKD